MDPTNARKKQRQQQVPVEDDKVIIVRALLRGQVR